MIAPRPPIETIKLNRSLASLYKIYQRFPIYEGVPDTLIHEINMFKSFNNPNNYKPILLSPPVLHSKYDDNFINAFNYWLNHNYFLIEKYYKGSLTGTSVEYTARSIQEQIDDERNVVNRRVSTVLEFANWSGVRGYYEREGVILENVYDNKTKELPVEPPQDLPSTQDPIQELPQQEPQPQPQPEPAQEPIQELPQVEPAQELPATQEPIQEIPQVEPAQELPATQEPIQEIPQPEPKPEPKPKPPEPKPQPKPDNSAEIKKIQREIDDLERMVGINPNPQVKLRLRDKIATLKKKMMELLR